MNSELDSFIDNLEYSLTEPNSLIALTVLNIPRHDLLEYSLSELNSLIDSLEYSQTELKTLLEYSHTEPNPLLYYSHSELNYLIDSLDRTYPPIYSMSIQSSL